MSEPANSSRVVWRVGGALTALVVVVAGAMLFWFDPSEFHFYPVCFFHRTTGLLCPGCGGLRALHQLLHGHVAAAFRFNPMLVLSLPLAAGLALRYGWQKAWRQPGWSGPRSGWLWLLLAVWLAVGLLRNMPGALFAMLRP